MTTITEVMRGAAEYPLGFEALDDAPPRIWVAGALRTGPRVGIVGTRRADEEARDFAEALARALGRAGVTIVSGGAEGIDAAAHRGALEAKAPTVVVQASPLDAPYPRAHRRLFDAVLAEGGAWLSETPLGEPPYPGRFLARNRLIAALSDVVVVVQAPARSGALSTARWAKDLRRPLFAVPSAPWDLRAAGCLRLLRDGARVCTGPKEIATVLGVSLARPVDPEREDAPEVPVTSTLSPELARVAAALSARPRHVDEIAQSAALPAPRVSVALVQLAARGQATQVSGGWRAVRRSRAPR